MLQWVAFGFGFEIWNKGRSAESGDGRESLYIGDMTPVFAMVHLRFRDASQRTTRDEAEPWPGSDAFGLPVAGARGGNSLATQRSP